MAPGTDPGLPRAFGTYLLIKKLGAGATGSVYLARSLARDRGLPTPVVVKCLHEGLGDREEFVKRFRHEGLIAVSVNSPHVAMVYDVGSVDTTPYIAMEHIEGWPLVRVFQELIRAGRLVPIAPALDLVVQGLRGLEALHTATDPETGQPLGIVHRDISPRNLMVGEDGQLRLIDLGLGRSNVQDWRTQTGTIMGSLGYIAPEQVTGGQVDHRADLYSMAIVLFEVLVLRPYVRRSDRSSMLRAMATPKFTAPSTYRPEIPAWLDAVLEKGLSAEPTRRYESARELAKVLSGHLSSPADRPRRSESFLGLFEAALREDLATTRADVSALLKAHNYDDFGEPRGEPTVFAARQDLTVTEPGPSKPSNTFDSDQTTTRATVLGPSPKKQRGVSSKVVVFFVAVAVLITLLADRYLFPLVLGPASTEQEELSQEAPEIEVMPEQPATLPVNPDDTRPLVHRLSKRVPRVKRKLTKRAKKGSATSAEPEREASQEPVDESIRRLTRLSLSIRKRRPDRADEIDAVLADISMWGGSTKHVRARKELSKLEARLRAIDAR